MEAHATNESPAHLRFGMFQVDLRDGELFKHGIRLRLQGQPFQVLTVLLERPGEVVSREELRARLWAANTFVDFDHSLNIAINKLRAVLGDSGANPRFIQTIPRRGYRFLAPVDVVIGATPSANRAAPAAPVQLTANDARPQHTPVATPPSRVARWAAVAAGAVSALTGRVSPYSMALLYTALGEKSLALRWLEKISTEK